MADVIDVFNKLLLDAVKLMLLHVVLNNIVFDKLLTDKFVIVLFVYDAYVAIIDELDIYELDIYELVIVFVLSVPDDIFVDTIDESVLNVEKVFKLVDNVDETVLQYKLDVDIVLAVTLFNNDVLITFKLDIVELFK